MNSNDGSTPGSREGSTPGSAGVTGSTTGASSDATGTSSAGSTPSETVVSTPSETLSTSAGAGAGSAGSMSSGDLGSTSGSDQQSDRLAKVKGEASRLRGEAGTRARGAAEEGKVKASETLGSLARSTRDAAGQFSGTQAEPLTQYINSAADSLESLARRIDEKSVDELLDDAREMVRRSPAIAIGAAVAAGFVLSRFLKASGGMGSSGNGYDTAGSSSRPPSQSGTSGGSYNATGESSGTPPVYNA